MESIENKEKIYKKELNYEKNEYILTILHSTKKFKIIINVKSNDYEYYEKSLYLTEIESDTYIKNFDDLENALITSIDNGQVYLKKIDKLLNLSFKINDSIKPYIIFLQPKKKELCFNEKDLDDVKNIHLERFSKSINPLYENINEMITNMQKVFSDETSSSINEKIIQIKSNMELVDKEVVNLNTCLEIFKNEFDTKNEDKENKIKEISDELSQIMTKDEADYKFNELLSMVDGARNLNERYQYEDNIKVILNDLKNLKDEISAMKFDQKIKQNENKIKTKINQEINAETTYYKNVIEEYKKKIIGEINFNRTNRIRVKSIKASGVSIKSIENINFTSYKILDKVISNDRLKLLTLVKTETNDNEILFNDSLHNKGIYKFTFQLINVIDKNKNISIGFVENSSNKNRYMFDLRYGFIKENEFNDNLQITLNIFDYITVLIENNNNIILYINGSEISRKAVVINSEVIPCIKVNPKDTIFTIEDL